MTKDEAIRILNEVIPPPEHHMVDLDHLRIAQAWQCIKETLTAEPSKDSSDNVFVMRANMFASDGIIKGLREDIADQIRSGVVVLPSYVELVAVTGPCTDVEVRIITEEEKHDGER